MTGAQAAPTLNLNACEKEPIHIPGAIQPHGMLIALSPGNFQILQVSTNCEKITGLPVGQVLGQPLETLFPESTCRTLKEGLSKLNSSSGPTYLDTFACERTGIPVCASAHQHDGLVLLELERLENLQPPKFESLYPLVTNLADRLRDVTTIEEIARLAVEEIRHITKFDRVLVYQFNDQWAGHVIAESSVSELPSFLDLWFPATDIPVQARRLYETNRQRLIVDANYQPVPITPLENPLTRQPLDLTMALLRSVSNSHLEYLRNMNLRSSMSVSLLRGDGQLWGLLVCHHRWPHFVGAEIRAACDLTAKLVASQVEVVEQRTTQAQRLISRSRTSQILAHVSEGPDLMVGLTKSQRELQELTNSDGVAVVLEGHCTRIGRCPSEVDIRDLLDWLLTNNRQEVFFTDKISLHLPKAEAYRSEASGMLAVTMSKIRRMAILWFRQELIKTVNWAGDPAYKHPFIVRTSFESWKETVRGTSRGWRTVDIEGASALRIGVVGIALGRATEEMADLSAELKRSNTELEAFSYSVSHDLRAPFRHIVGYAELLAESATATFSENDRRYLDIIVKQAHYAGTLVDNLLSFSQVGRTNLELQQTDMALLVFDVRRMLQNEVQERQVTWRIGRLPGVKGDPMMLRLVWQNLLHNALKYTRNQEMALIEIDCRGDDREDIFSVKDNGVGFDQAYAGRLFGIFQRLHRVEDFEGTGIGLANVRRIIARHGGRTWAQGAPNQGAEFFFSLPKNGGAV